MEFTPSSIVARSVAVARIAERARRRDETEHEARNRVSHRISYAVKRGELVESSRGFFVFGDLAGWVRNTWPELFNDWPRKLYGYFDFTWGFRSSADAVVLPGSLKPCHDMIRDMHEKIAGLEKSLQRVQLEIERLRPDAEQWHKLRDRNRANASKPRK